MARYSTTSDIELLQRYAKNAKTGIVEIGVLDGETTKLMAEVASVPLYGIDPIIPDSMEKSLIGSEDNIRKNLSFYSDFHFFRDFSFNVVKNWNSKFDFIFIDGDHRYDGVRRDLDDWLPLLDVYGHLALHDVFPNPEGFSGWPGPRKLFDELINDERLKIIEIVNSIPVFMKVE